MPRKDALLKVRLTDDLKAEAETLAAAQGESLSVVIRQALRQYLDQHRVDLETRDSTPALPRLNPVYPETTPSSMRLNEPASFTDAGTATTGQPSPGAKMSKGA